MNRPSNSARLNESLEGLEASIVRLSEVLSGASTKRFDPEYFQKKYLKDAILIQNISSAFKTPHELGISVDASAFYPSIEEYYGTGELPFYRVGDVDGMVNVAKATRIPSTLCIMFPTLKAVNPGDILFTKGGAVDRAGYVVERGAVSRDLIFLNTSCMPENQRLMMFAYFRSGLFRRMLLRSSSQTTQPHLTITLVRELPIFLGSPDLNEAIASTIKGAYECSDLADDKASEAHNILLTALGLEGWTPPNPLGYTAKISDVLKARRLDSQYFRPLFTEVERRLAETGRAIELGSILSTNARGRQPSYADSGLPVINSKHVRTNRVILNENRTAAETPTSLVIEKGDVLVNGTGVGTIGRAAPYLHEQRALPDNHVTILRSNHVDPVYLAVFLNSPLGQWQIERHIKGSSGQIELYPDDIAKIVFWDAPEEIQMGVRDAVLSAFEEERRANELLEAAKRAVEIAIEEGEVTALAFLDQIEEGN